MKRCKKYILMLTIIVIAMCLAFTACSSSQTMTVREYSNEVQQQAQEWAALFTTLQVLLEYPQFGNEIWVNSIDGVLGDMVDLNDRAQALKPPDSMIETDILYKSACDHYVTSVALLRAGIEVMDASLIDQATNELSIGTALLHQAIEAIQNISE